MSVGFQRFVLANSLALRGGVSVVRSIIASNKEATGFTTDELYKLALQQPPPPDYYNPHTQAGLRFPPMPTPKTKGKQRLPAPEPPNPEHPVRSKAFLKKSIMPFLVGTQEIKKTRVDRIIDKSALFKIDKKGRKVPLYTGENSQGTSEEKVWVWMPTETTTSELPSHPQPSNTVQRPFGAEVGVGEDLSHLSKKRQKARRAEILREVHQMKVMAGIRKQKERSLAGFELRQKQAAKKTRILRDMEEGESETERIDRPAFMRRANTPERSPRFNEPSRR